MVENELLFAISTLLDTKLEPMKTDIGNIKQEMVEMKTDIGNIKQEMVEMKTDIHKINLKMENDFGPKLQLLAENYVPAAKRYESEVDKMETMRADIDVMKQIITEHSEKIQMLA